MGFDCDWPPECRLIQPDVSDLLRLPPVLIYRESGEHIFSDFPGAMQNELVFPRTSRDNKASIIPAKTGLVFTNRLRKFSKSCPKTPTRNSTKPSWI
jgi:hypothetical protein